MTVHLEALAESVKFVPDTDISWAGAHDWMLRHYGKQVGRLEGKSGAVVRLFAGSVRNYGAGRRKVPGFTVVWSAHAGEVNTSAIPTRDKAYARAALALYERDGVKPGWAQLTDPKYLRGKE